MVPEGDAKACRLGANAGSIKKVAESTRSTSHSPFHYFIASTDSSSLETRTHHVVHSEDWEFHKGEFNLMVLQSCAHQESLEEQTQRQTPESPPSILVTQVGVRPEGLLWKKHSMYTEVSRSYQKSPGCST